jgi:circadian clock protein KaiC
LSQEAKDEAEELLRQQEIGRNQFGLERKREAMEAQILVLRSEFEAEESDALKAIGIEKARIQRISKDRAKMAKNRKSDVSVTKSARTKG